MPRLFDRADPSLDPDYCDGLSDPPPPLCIWCGDPCPNEDHLPYCSGFCGIAADIDSMED